MRHAARRYQLVSKIDARRGEHHPRRHSSALQRDRLRASRRAVRNGNRRVSRTGGRRLECCVDVAVCTSCHADSASISLRKVAAVRARDSDTRDVQRRRSAICQPYYLCRAARAHALIPKVYRRRRERHRRRDSSTRQSHRLRTPREIMCDCDRAVAHPGSRGFERDVHSAARPDRQSRRAHRAGVGLREISADRDSGGRRSRAIILHRNRLRRTARPYQLVGKSQALGRNADRRRSLIQ